MTIISDIVKAYIEEEGFRYTKTDKGVFDFGLNLSNGAVRVRIVAMDEEDLFMVYAFWEGKLPVRSLPIVLPIVNEINSSTRCTTMCVDPSDGELSCHCGFSTKGSTFEVQQVMVSLQITVMALDDNIERLMRAAWSAPANADGKYN